MADKPITSSSSPELLPCLMIRGGHVLLPGEGGPKTARHPSGQLLDVLEVADQLAAKYPRIYVVDLDGVEHQQPQLDYLQELSRIAEIWVDSGIRSADQAIDTIVAGARRAILSTLYLQNPRELKRAWKLTTDAVVEIEVHGGTVVGRSPDWQGANPTVVASSVREIGIQEVVLGFREDPVNWTLVREVARGGPTWVEGTFDPSMAATLADSGARGGIFHIAGILASPVSSPG